MTSGRAAAARVGRLPELANKISALRDPTLQAQAAATAPQLNIPAGATVSNPAGTPAAAPVNRRVDVGVRFANEPPGMAVTTARIGPALAPLRVERSSVGLVGQGAGR